MASSRGQIIPKGYGYLVRIYIGRDTTGKRDYQNQRVTGTKKDAEKVLTAMLRKLDMGELLHEPSQLTVKDYLEHWLVTAAKPRLAQTTYDDYAYLLKCYVDKSLGKTRLSKLEPQQIQALYSSMLSQGLSPRTVRYTQTVLSNALKQAVRWRMVPDNPAKYVDLPKRQRQEMSAMTQEEVDRFLEAAKSNRHYVLFALMLGTGLRPGEAIALKWVDLDAMKAILYIQRSYSPSTGMKTTKNAKNRRRIKLPEHLVMLLLEHKEALPFESNLMFPNLDNKPLYDRNVVLRHYNPCLRVAGLGETVEVEEDGTVLKKFMPAFRFYDLRHTHATLLLKAGVHPKIVSERLGHSSITLTLDTYSHVLPGMQDEAADMLNDMLFKNDEEVDRRSKALN